MKFKSVDQIDPRAAWVLRGIDTSLDYEVVGPYEGAPGVLNVRLPDGVRPFHPSYMVDPPLHLLVAEEDWVRPVVAETVSAVTETPV